MSVRELNKGLVLIGTSPIEEDKMRQKRYSSEKLQNISEALKTKVFSNIPHDDTQSIEDEDEDDEASIVQKLKERYNTTEDKTMRIRILTIFSHWSFRKIKQHFEATNQMIIVAKRTAAEKGILSTPNPKTHPTLERSIIESIIAFYQSDTQSRVLPGQKDTVSVKIDGQKVQMQKRLILNNLKELFQEFKSANPGVKCSFSKFASLRPKHCVLAGASGTHSVCVCAIHENVKLLIDGANIGRLTGDSSQPLKNYNDCLNRMICSPPSIICYLGKCDACPGITNVIQQIEKSCDDNLIDSITYKQWTTVDRTTLQTLISPVEDYLEKLENGLSKLLLHSFLVKKQNEFLNNKKQSLPRNECIVICDFSENYAFVIQNSIQGIHWNNDQATVHPFAIYYRDNDNEVKMKSLVIISECLHHDTIAFHVFQRYLIQFITTYLINIKKIIYFSDGASAQYKNKKNFINLCHHEEDFGITAEWHFFPTSHGKGPCDGLGGTLKRLASRTSLQRINNPIQTPQDLFTWASESLPNIACRFVTNEEYDEEEKILETRFKKAMTIKGTLGFHCIIPLSKNKLQAKQFSLHDIFIHANIMKK